MSLIPPEETPLNQHSLLALELWLRDLGAKQSDENPCIWTFSTSQWTAELQLEKDELRVTWEQEGKKKQCCFPYGLPRKDVVAAINHGP